MASGFRFFHEKPRSTLFVPSEEEGWTGGYSGKGDGFGRYVNPDGSCDVPPFEPVTHLHAG